ncbi:hypothetical protein WJX74_001097 [Apatococcus lobatus]|uniref:Uncharacterized protein n=1 Tax=Apatococcus lobatus TaxID=904363 RepID=A0AAW1QBV3_9CHLO
MAKPAKEDLVSPAPSSAEDLDCNLLGAKCATSDSSAEPKFSGEATAASHSVEDVGNTAEARPSTADTGPTAPHSTLCVPSEDSSEETAMLLGWRYANKMPSLPEVHGSVKFPGPGSHWTRKFAAFVGLGFMVSVGYMDPGNWATDLAAGSSYGYKLLIVILLSNFCAMFLQFLSLKLGVVAERDLAQACRDAYPKWICYILWFLAEVAIAATDLAEVIGSATALYLLFNLPLWAGVLITSVDVLVLLVFGMHNIRLLELFVFMLCALIAAIFAYELGVVNPNWKDVGKGFIPRKEILTDAEILYTAIGILGATVMPHNLYLHSSIVQSRAYQRSLKGKQMAIKYGAIDSTMSLSVAFFINAAILILAAAAFFYKPGLEHQVATLTDAYQLLQPAVGGHAAKILFAVALLAAGQNSTITGTLAGQIVMEGFLHIRLKPWLRRAITRGIAIIPAAIVTGIMGNAGAARLLVLSQVILSLQLTFAVVPMVHFTTSRAKMGRFVNGWIVTIIAVLIALIIAGLNAYLVVESAITNEFGQAAGGA